MRSSTSRHLPGRLLGALAGPLLLAVGLTACQGSSTTTVAVPATTTASAAPATSGAAGAAAYFAQYGIAGHVRRPHRLNPSADGSLFIVRMHWTLWNGSEAVGTGVAHVNDCTPDCADGHYATHRVTVRLTDPRAFCGSRYFMTFRVTGPAYHTRAHWYGVVCH